MGQSNSGKSSLMNKIFNCDLCGISKFKGKTKSIQIAKSIKKTYIIDTPGYG